MGQTYVAAIDQGTTSSRCIVFDDAGAIVAEPSGIDFDAHASGESTSMR